mgnify:CR=1 FL=1
MVNPKLITWYFDEKVEEISGEISGDKFWVDRSLETSQSEKS